jgi:hypothetical protein
MVAEMRYQELINTVYGRLLVVGLERRNKRAICLCTCGNIKSVAIAKLKGGQQSCGCLTRDVCRERMTGLRLGAKSEGVAARNYAYHVYKKGARSRNIPFELSFEDFIDVVTKPCVYCGRSETRKITHNNRKNLFNGYFYCTGVDRLDNKQGYTFENSVSCCWDCNNAKKDMSYDEFSNWIKLVYTRMFENET